MGTPGPGMGTCALQSPIHFVNKRSFYSRQSSERHIPFLEPHKICTKSSKENYIMIFFGAFTILKEASKILSQQIQPPQIKSR